MGLRLMIKEEFPIRELLGRGFLNKGNKVRGIGGENRKPKRKQKTSALNHQPFIGKEGEVVTELPHLGLQL